MALPFLIAGGWSCKKETSAAGAPANPIIGLWIGTQLNAALPGDTLYYSLDVQADSNVVVTSTDTNGATNYLLGRWSLSGILFTATVNELNTTGSAAQHIQATFNQSKAWLFGGWVDDDNGMATFTTFRVP